MKITLEEFQRSAKSRTVGPGVKPQPYTSEEREFAVQFAQMEMAAGSSRSSILRTLGISDGALTKWLSPKDSTSGRGFRRVQLEAEQKTMGKLTLVTPGGHRIEGLSMESAISLLKALG